MQFLLNDIAENLEKRVQRQRQREKLRQQQQQASLPQGSAGSVAAAGGDGALGAGAGTSTFAGDGRRIGSKGFSVSNVGNGEEEQPEDLRTWVHDIFQGYLVNQMKCLCCENVSVRRETFLDLSVDIERRTSLAACLRAFESTELLRAGNKFFCDRCGCHQEAEKRLRIYQLPRVLTLHLKRFKYLERLGRCCRLPYRVVFPLQLRVVEHRPRRRHDSTGAVSASGRPASSPGARSKHAAASSDGGSVATEQADAEDTPGGGESPSRLFELRSVVVHIGRDPSRGHYVTVVRHGDRCVLLDDETLRVVEPEVLRSFYGTAGGDPPERPQTGASHDRLPASPSRPGSGTPGGCGGSGNGWSVGGEGGNGFSQSAPLYELSPEGTCCGYLLFYEAVDSAGSSPLDAMDSPRIGGRDSEVAADWISEDRDFAESDSGESAAADNGQPWPVQDRHPGACDDSELTQAFEQRCLPRHPSSVSSPSRLRPGGFGGAGLGGVTAPVELDAETLDQQPGLATTGDCGVPSSLPVAAASPSAVTAVATVGFGSVCAPGSVATLPQPGAAALLSDTVSPSRVNVVTMPMPLDSSLPPVVAGVLEGDEA
eukprot:TRINITY_DN49410_c0_g1_i1.p1 TRINITY_DN49410_c0_g1~~TRINITY_DN49410_c0_g1_i1.p1  ORF type:complete len:598 (-),score=96.60 TRINITY_DN49410_c0_g1_i1:88-1881(-)